LAAALKAHDESVYVKKQHDIDRAERKEYQKKMDASLEIIHNNKRDLVLLQNKTAEEKSGFMKQLSEEQTKHSKTTVLLNDERTKAQDLKSTVSRMNADICNYSDLKKHITEQQKSIHDEKVRYAQLNDRNHSLIQKFELEMNEKNREIESVKEQLGSTINKLTNSECKVRDLETSLRNSKDSLGKATLNITRLSDNLKDENTRYAKLVSDSRKDRSGLQIS